MRTLAQSLRTTVLSATNSVMTETAPLDAGMCAALGRERRQARRVAVGGGIAGTLGTVAVAAIAYRETAIGAMPDAVIAMPQRHTAPAIAGCAIALVTLVAAAVAIAAAVRERKTRLDLAAGTFARYAGPLAARAIGARTYEIGIEGARLHVELPAASVALEEAKWGIVEYAPHSGTPFLLSITCYGEPLYQHAHAAR